MAFLTCGPECLMRLLFTQTIHARALRIKELEARLSEKTSQIASLEEKHQHARDNLEHYRQSVKEQRDAEIRRFEHQMQQLHVEKRELTQKLGVKQEGLSKMARENSMLTTRLADSHATLDRKSVV